MKFHGCTQEHPPYLSPQRVEGIRAHFAATDGNSPLKLSRVSRAAEPLAVNGSRRNSGITLGCSPSRRRPSGPKRSEVVFGASGGSGGSSTPERPENSHGPFRDENPVKELAPSEFSPGLGFAIGARLTELDLKSLASVSLLSVLTALWCPAGLSIESARTKGYPAHLWY